MRLLLTACFALFIACDGGPTPQEDDTDGGVDTPSDTDVFETGWPDTHHQGPNPPEDTGGGGPGPGGGGGSRDTGECGYGEAIDCAGRCWPEYFVGDGTCDDGGEFRSDFDCAQHGFDGGDCLSETDPPPLVADVGCPVIVRTFSGNWAVEIGWKITKNNRTILNKAFGAFGSNNLLYADLLYLEPGTYKFVMRDLLGDGWNAASYTISGPSGEELGSGALAQGFSRTDTFVVTCDRDTGEPPPPPPDCGAVTLSVSTLQFGHQIGWELKDRDQSVIVAAPFGTYANNRTYEHPANLPQGWYIFSLLDNYGDGWNGATYAITDDSTGNTLTAGTLSAGSSLDVPFLFACTPGFDPGPPPQVEGITCDDLYVRMETADDAAELGWQLIDPQGAVALDMQPGSYANFGSFLTPVSLSSGAWTVRLLDSAGDGWRGSTFELVDINSGYQFALGGPTFNAGSTFDIPTQVVCTTPPDPPVLTCAPDAVQDCDQVCWPQAFIGDGWCDDGGLYAANFDCVRFQRDGGDCPQVGP
jgi:hypothetical protein